LRKNYHSGQCSWQDFADAYRSELAGNQHLDSFMDVIRQQPVVTLLSSVKDVDHSHVPVLLQVIRQRLESDAQR